MMTVYRLLHTSLILSLIGHPVSLLCLWRYGCKIRRNTPEKAAHEIACTALRRLVDSAVGWGCLFAALDALLCFGLWLISPASAEAEALLQMLRFAAIALTAGCTGFLIDMIALFAVQDSHPLHRIARRARHLPRVLVLLGVLALLFTAFLLS